MPYAATHILIPVLFFAIMRDFYARKRDKKNFPLHYVLIAGIGGVLPDLDIPISIILNLIGVENWNVHRTFLHSLLFPLIFFVLFAIFKPMKIKICHREKHILNLGTIFLVLSAGILSHIVLDSTFGEIAFFLYPLSSYDFGINLINYLPLDLQDLALPTLDGALLIIWLVYLEIKHKISDFI